MPSVLVTGGSGYLGQFLIHGLHPQFKVTFTYSTRMLNQLPAGVVACKVDLVTGEGLQQAIQDHGPFDCVINCAAMSQPGQCEKEPEAARAVNVPTQLLASLQQHQPAGAPLPLLIHISTDQVYAGTRSMWKESDECEPVNVYGRSKLEAEQAVKAWPGSSVILRSSIIYGPQAPEPLPRSLFLQFVDGVVSRKEPNTFFEDEWRCPIYVQDIIQIVKALADAHASGAGSKAGSCTVLNMGGPERLSRVDMARAVARYRGLTEEEMTAIITPVPAASVSRGVASPADISMDIKLLVQHTGIAVTRFADALDKCLA